MQTQYRILLKHSWLVPTAVNVYEMSLILIIIIVSFQDADPVTEKLYDSSEEGKKVTRNHGDKYLAFFRRVERNTNSKPDS